jgi:hypothetical protein
MARGCAAEKSFLKRPVDISKAPPLVTATDEMQIQQQAVTIGKGRVNDPSFF